MYVSVKKNVKFTITQRGFGAERLRKLESVSDVSSLITVYLICIKDEKVKVCFYMEKYPVG